MPSLDFFKYLEKRLKTGNLKSIHLNALPGKYATRLDLNKLNVVQDQLGNEFLSKLTQESKFKFTVSFNNINLNDITEEQQDELNFVAKKLNGIYYQNNDNYLEHGIKTFGFGYPLLIKRSKQDPKKVIKAPLLIWHLDIRKSLQKRNVWEFYKDEDSPINLNEVLISYLKQDENITINRLSKEYLEDDVIDNEEIVKVCNEIMDQFNVTNEKNLNVHLAPCPNREKVENITANQPWISWSGIFGLYRAQKESIINEIDELIENIDTFEFDNLKIEPYQTSTITSVKETDPSQEEIINSLNKAPERIIQGPPGTGKSQSLTAIITNAIESGAKCLVVCEKKTALDVIYNNLNELGLGNLCAVVDDVSRDRRKIIDSVRNKIDTSKYHRPTFRKHEYNSYLKSYNKIKNEINQKHWSLLKNIFGDDNWKDLIGHYLSNEKVASKEYIKRDLNSYTFICSYDEFTELLQLVREGKYYFEKIGRLGHPLEYLNDEIFNGPYLTSTKEQIEDFLRTLNESCHELFTKYNDYLNEFGEEFNNNTTLNHALTKFFSLFLSRYKRLDKARRAFRQHYQKLIKIHYDYEYFGYNFPKMRQVKNFLEIYQTLESYKQIIENILAESHLFPDFYHWKSFYLSQNGKQRHLLKTLIRSGLNNWEEAFKSWYYDRVLTKYESEIGPLHQDDRSIKKLRDLNHSLKKMQINKIADLWAWRQKQSINRFQEQVGNLKNLYNYRKNKKYGRKNPLRSIVHADFELFTDFFPVLMVNPVVSSSIIPLKEGLFDVVIFDEASQLRLEDTFTSYLKGKFKIISGDEHQMPPSNYFGKEIALDSEDTDNERDESKRDQLWDESLESADKESLLHYATDSNFDKSYLDFHYRSRHPFLIEFSNAAFYGSRLTPMPEKNSYKPIRFIPVNGLYEKNRTNPTEAKYVVDILFDKIRPYDNGEYPSIGIATFNIDQRNKILELIQDECYMDDSKREKNEKLRASGLFVKNLENIQGDERDIMILSTTFGLNSSGKFRQNFGPINRSKGYKLFNVLITRAKRKLILCTSIPQEYYERYREEIPVKGNTGKAIFYAYLAYAASIERGDEETRQNILDLIREQCEAESLVKPEKFVESPFEQEVYDYLIDYIDEDRIEIQYAFGGFRIDFVIKSKHDERPIIAIECDGAQYHDSEEAYAHDMYRQKIIEQEGGFHFYRIWSTNWWPDPEKEVRKLVDFIEAKDSEGSEKEIVEHYRDEIIDESFNTLETVSVNNTFKEKQATAEKSVVTSDSDVQIKNIHDGSKMTIRFTDLKSKVDLKSRDRKIVHEDSPLAKALYNRAVGEKFKINGIEVYYEILDIEN